MKHLYLFLSLGFATVVSAQNILLVSDNDLILDNTDSITDALNLSTYSLYDHWNIPDSAGAYPTSVFMADYDLVIWYCSTDGAGLKLWEDGTGGNAELVTYLLDGKPAWIIGADMLYQEYGSAPDAFSAGDFAYDFMGLSGYNVQSYGDDGNLGVPQVDALSGIPAYFPDSLLWAFSTAWWVDGVTGLPGTTAMYEMGPSSYTLAGEISMVYSDLNSVQVMSSFFDPALINNQQNRIAFLEAGITYLLPDDLGIAMEKKPALSVYPNPASDFVTIRNSFTANADYTLTDMSGAVVLKSIVESGQQVSLDLSTIPAGVYLLQGMTSEGVLMTEKVVIY